MAIMDVFITALVIVTSQVITGQTEGAGRSRWNISATVEEGLIKVTAQYTMDSTDDKPLDLQLACPEGDPLNSIVSKNGVFVVSIRGVCDNVRARSNATFTVFALTGRGDVIEAVNRTVYVHVGLPWRPVEIVRYPTSVNTSVVLAWRTAYVVPSDAFRLKYWCSGSGSMLAHELRTSARHVTLKDLDNCEEYEVRLYAVNAHGQSPPLDFRFCANETQMYQPGILLSEWVIVGLTLSSCLLVFAVSATCSLAFRHFRGRKEPPSPKGSEEACPANVETEHTEQLYENVDLSRPPKHERQTHQTRGDESARDTDAMLPATGNEPTVQSVDNAEQSDAHEQIEPSGRNSYCKSEIIEDDEKYMYENVGATRKIAATMLKSNAKTDTPTTIDTATLIGIALEKGPSGQIPKPSPRPRNKLPKSDSSDIYIAMAKGNQKRARKRSEENGKEAAGNSPTHAHDETPEAAEDMYINPCLRVTRRNDRSNRSSTPTGRKYLSDLYDTAP